jgi:serine/threonine protein kinase
MGVYTLDTLLGRGGMGEVYRARDNRLGRDVAIKVLPRAFTANPERLARFEREARLLAALNHPHIGMIHGVEEGDHVLALVLELVEGDTLADRLARARSRSRMHSTGPVRLPTRSTRHTTKASCTAISNRRTSRSPRRAS